ncbi:Tripartite tricarboxylate transporter TctA family protein [uncultured archaeon]|nr:Tripartite tricarboxylate transporter TctA family protein [uncultured archaeon]
MLIPLLVGILLGIVAGLLPGVHPNAISYLLGYMPADAMDLSIAIIASAAANNILSLIPAIFLFVPDTETVLSVLPGHNMVQLGLGRKAIVVCGWAALLSLLFLLIILPVSFAALPSAYSAIRPVLGPLLAALALFFLFEERSKGIGGLAKGAFVFLLAGALGVVVLDSPLLAEPLFPAFTGFFAFSSLLLSSGNASIPKQESWPSAVPDKMRALATVVLFGSLLGVAADLLPALGSPAQLATFGSPLMAGSPSMFLALTTSITVGHSANSLVALQTIGKGRIGATAMVNDLIGQPSTGTTLVLLAAFFIATAVSIALLFVLSDLFIRFIGKVDLRKVNVLLFIYLLAAVLYTGGVAGILVAATATAMGTLPPLLGVRRTHLMGFLIVPTILVLIV